MKKIDKEEKVKKGGKGKKMVVGKKKAKVTKNTMGVFKGGRK